LCSPSVVAVTEDYLYELRSEFVLFDNVEYVVIGYLSSPVGARLKEFTIIFSEHYKL